MRSKVTKHTTRFETVPLAKVPKETREDLAARKLVGKEEPYAIQVTSDVEVRSLKRKPGH
jgi:hypothetical protein